MLVNFFKNRKGQALVELLIGVSIGALILGSSAGVIVSVVNSNSRVAKSKAATQLGQELIDDVRVLADKNWKSFYELSKGSTNHYYVATSTPLAAVLGDEVVTRNGVAYTRWFFVENVNRATSGDNIATSGGVIDPSTQKAVVRITWDNADGLTFTQFMTRHKNFVFHQSDWSQGINSSGTLIKSGSLYASTTGVNASTTGQLKLNGF
ncbi:MAG: hypothetical protein COV57_00875 [Candidatus Liptonbacteria bacterium CG11_big_fil_rev_8_21_14_0_20_35_14]|uniref:Uncharacterized protein n=1 Tax=Candidatus Liptonbacteria bacterium CG11_big_fil_rev_8_21_14_0_20_35_14 TaxID=1974634 RepID=A0A2H0N884_9BACT|nr:MAG: hypothetical protein COV57_00875 [Candidatus Liptonbacteria bacterium CG11_big_fil_rev_8_21_14_0_20_35_14]